ncbi:MAG: NUDIX hydrolase [Bacteroidota bacterium]
MKEIKPAATIMLARDYEGRLQVLLLRRNRALKFAGGLWVFPGGKIDKNELEASATEREAALTAAVRETMEEANIKMSKDDLIFFSHWTTPAIEPRRFATWFFFGAFEQQNVKVTIDDGEIKAYRWLHPQEALDALQRGELAMLPPTLISLQIIRKCNTTKEAKAKIQSIEPAFILPVLRPQGSKMICMYEGDAGYVTGNPNEVGARHRLTIDMAKGDFLFEYQDCEDFPPVNAGMHLPL